MILYIYIFYNLYITAAASPLLLVEDTVRAMEQGSLKIRVRSLENEKALERIALSQGATNSMLLGSVRRALRRLETNKRVASDGDTHGGLVSRRSRRDGASSNDGNRDGRGGSVGGVLVLLSSSSSLRSAAALPPHQEAKPSRAGVDPIRILGPRSGATARSVSLRQRKSGRVVPRPRRAPD
jgi:hypothetical protein